MEKRAVVDPEWTPDEERQVGKKADNKPRTQKIEELDNDLKKRLSEQVQSDLRK